MTRPMSAYSQATDDVCLMLRAVTRTFPSPAGTVTALAPLDLTVRRGEFVAIVGPSGSGKSTLLQLLTGIDRPSAGELLVAGAALHELGEQALARWRRRNVGIVFQFFQLLPTLTALENVLLPMELGGVHHPRDRRRRALTLLEQVGLREQAQRRPHELSGGQQQRVAIARALANDPPLLVADEPTGNLDSRSAAAVFDLLAGLAQAGTTVLFVTHDAGFAQRAQRVITLTDGMLISDSAAEPVATSAHPVAEVVYA